MPPVFPLLIGVAVNKMPQSVPAQDLFHSLPIGKAEGEIT
jgi:hypothetical protein